MNRENTAEKNNRNEETPGICLEDERIDDLQRNFKGQFKYADRLGAKLAVVIGDNELENGVATCKDMISGEQTEVRFEDLKAEIDKRLSAEPQECKDK